MLYAKPARKSRKFGFTAEFAETAEGFLAFWKLMDEPPYACPGKAFGVKIHQ